MTGDEWGGLSIYALFFVFCWLLREPKLWP